jgi:hypothetical protein
MMEMLTDGSWRRMALALGLLGIVLILLTGLLLLNTYWGDPSIYLPYARNIARGDFFSYDPGAFSSGSTSPLWAMILSVPFLLGAGPTGAKILSLLATLAAFITVLIAARRVSGDMPGASVASLYVVEMMTLFGLLMYESSLVVALVALSLIIGNGMMGGRGATNEMGESRDEQQRFGAFVPLILVWAALPLARPDAVALVLLQFIALWVYLPGKRSANFLRLLGAGIIAAIPSVLYFGYSWVTLGAVSVSSRGRAFALHEAAQKLGPIFFSKPALVYLGSILYALLLAALGLDLFRRDTPTRWLALYGAGALIIYPVLLVFAQPVTNDLPRYFLPIAPIIVVGIARIFRQWREQPARLWAAVTIVLAVAFVLKPAGSLLGDAIDQRGRGYSFDEIVEREAAETVNRIAKPGDTLLAYEVQDRYYLRDDIGIMSLDGLTDGRVAPFLASGDMAALLKQHRPEYWLANSAVDYRPYLQNSILHDVVERCDRDSSLQEVTLEGITFRLVQRRTRPMPRGFAGWTYLFELGYGAEPARR